MTRVYFKDTTWLLRRVSLFSWVQKNVQFQYQYGLTVCGITYSMCWMAMNAFLYLKYIWRRKKPVAEED